MLSHLKTIFGARESENALFTPAQLALCAVFLEAAHADGTFGDAERGLIRREAAVRFGLDEDATEDLLAEAERRREESPDLFLFAREINASFALNDKLSLIETLWRIIYSDGVLNRYEDTLARELASLLHLSHQQLIDAKLKVLDEIRRVSGREA
jgi:uncharacterized tellurite resistance protein B-like protein